MELSKNFIPAEAEQKWTATWKEKKYFNSKPDERKSFTVVIPPPNVTGVLHMGHTLNETVQDILVRRARMSGYNACWVPGSDHASIATEAKVVQMLKEKGIDKNTLTREEFLHYAFEWKEKYGGIIYNQIERLGCSVDWDRVTFTMDDHYYKAVIKVFVDLYNKGLIYRGARMIHWDPAAQTALSDEEVEYKDIQGKLYYVKYKIANDNLVQEPISIYRSTKELLTKAKDIIHSLVEKIKTDKSNSTEKTVIGSVTKEGAVFLTDLTGIEITSEYKHTIDRSSINHVLNNHSNVAIEENRGQSAITEQDFELVIDVLNQPDEIIASGKNNQEKETITYTKKFEDGTIIYLEEIRTGKKELMLQTMRKMKGKIGLESSLQSRRAMLSETSESFSHTSETTPATAKIPKVIDFGILADSSEQKDYLTIATSRPETIMGDVAVCVNPNDERYSYLKGKKVFVPLINREIPIIYDEHVDITFGTGVLKVTPAHDINDYNLGIKYNLEVIDTLNADGTLSEAAQIFVGEDRFTARKKAVEALKEKNLFIKEEEYPTRLGYSQRSGAVVEPRISTQWFLKMKELAKPALDAVLSGNIKIHPGDKFLATYKHWLENVKDWCISRQLWWGQQIPAWYDNDGKCYVAETKEEAIAKAKGKRQKNEAESPNLRPSTFNFTRDSDVLDTWFSSWLWPMEVFNGISHPNNDELKYYYPTSVLVTGQDIIFFWVARMVMAGLEYEKEIPFHDVYFTGMVRDKQGRKMSKSLGNSPNLLTLIDTYGADAVRFGIMISSPAGNDLLFDEASLEQGRNFNNKIWNALKLVKMWEEKISCDSKIATHDFATVWFENRLNEVKNEVAQLHAQFRLSEGLKTIYSLIWDDFCSWYIEWVKPNFGENISKNIYDKTVYFFEELLQLLHPYMPFITEEIYHLLKKQHDDLCVRQFAEIEKDDKNILQQGELLKKIISSVRDVRNKNNVKPKDTIGLQIQTENKTSFNDILPIFQKQINAEAIGFTDIPIDNNVVVTLEKDKFFVHLNQQIDKEALKNDLLKDLEYQQKFLKSVSNKLSNERFVQNAKPEIVAIEKKKQSDAEARIKTIEESLASLN